MEVLLGLGFTLFLVVPIIFAVTVAVMSIPLYFTTKMFGVANSSFGQAIKVNLIALGLSFVAGIGLSVMSMVIPVLPNLISLVLPFVIYVMLVQKEYELNTMESVIVTAVQYVVGFLLAVALVLAVLVPLGLGAAVLSA